MSSILFNCQDIPSRQAPPSVSGRERAAMSLMCHRLTDAVLEPLVNPVGARDGPKISDLFPPELRRLPTGLAMTSIHVDSHPLVVRGRAVPFFDVALNTALALGSEPVALFARLHGQCEIHAYLLPEDAEWFAGVIDEGRDIGLFRAEQGWESVAALLRRARSPVVTSYSVTEGFPNPSSAGIEPPADLENEDDWCEWDAFDKLSDDEQWSRCLNTLLERPGLRIEPQSLRTIRFGTRLTAFDLLDAAYKPEGPDRT